MKAVQPIARPGRTQPRMKTRLRAHQVRMYKQRREVESVDWSSVRDLRLPVQFMLRKVVTEASRLSAGNRYCTITQREVRTAVQLMCQHLRPNRSHPMDGA